MSNIVFLDVDGTLIDYEAKLPASAAKAVDQARANGHKVYICTGCSKAEILQRNLCDLDGMIGGNGAYVEDNGHVVMHQGLSKEDVKNIVDWCNERHIGFYLEANSGMYCNDYMLEQGPETMVKYAKGKGASLENAKSSAQHFIDGFIHLQGDELYRDDVNKISFIFPAPFLFKESLIMSHHHHGFQRAYRFECNADDNHNRSTADCQARHGSQSAEDNGQHRQNA